jgi:NADH:ubiquinone oxidoreductase subunit E
MSEAPARRLRVVVCRGVYCNLSRRAERVIASAEAEIAALPGEDGCRIRLEQANCLSMCALAPNAVLYSSSGERVVLNTYASGDLVLEAMRAAHARLCAASDHSQP